MGETETVDTMTNSQTSVLVRVSRSSNEHEGHCNVTCHLRTMNTKVINM